ncbi:MAG: PRC-barrel domain-containing protein [Thermoclostridium sp.]|nr:PRC-barrel domain-containing protein [Thermoclostridium sp.]
MKKSQQIIGLPIISIAEGNEVGKVKNIVINADKGTIDYFVVDSGVQVLNTRVIPAGNVLGVGEYAMTILNPEAISDISNLPAAIELLQKNITVKGTRVLTKKGSLIGETGDIYVDVNKECNIVGIEYIADITQKKIRMIPRSSVITFGKTLLVVEDDVQEKLLDDPSDLSESIIATEQKKVDEPVAEAGSAPGIVSDEEIELAFAQEQPAVAKPSEPEAIQPEQKSSAAGLFEERQRNYLKGRKATKSITDNQGTLIIRAGEEITDQAMDRAKGCGKLIELVMNNEA